MKHNLLESKKYSKINISSQNVGNIVFGALAGCTVRIFLDSSIQINSDRVRLFPSHAGYLIDISPENHSLDKSFNCTFLTPPPLHNISDNKTLRIGTIYRSNFGPRYGIVGVTPVKVIKFFIIKNLLKMLKEDWIEGVKLVIPMLNVAGIDYPEIRSIQSTVEKEWFRRFGD